MVDILDEIGVDIEDYTNKNIYKFAMQYSARKLMGKYLQYRNGNGIVETDLYSHSTRVTVLKDTEFIPSVDEEYVDIDIEYIR